MGRWLTADLADLTDRRGLPAALILVVVHLAAPLLALLPWALGLLPVFDGLRWIPVTLETLVVIALLLGVFVRFGAWATARTQGLSFGEDYTETFSPGTGFALGWLRWLMQLVMAGLIIFPLFMAWSSTRGWHITGTEALDALPAQAREIPVPDDWQLERTTASETGIPEFVTSTEFGESEPRGYVEQLFTAPREYTAKDLEQWLEGSTWQGFPEGDPYGELRIETCDAEQARCTAQFTPPSGGEAEHFLTVVADEHGPGETRVQVRLTYRAYSPPDWGVSQETIEQARSIPIPSDWFRIDAYGKNTRDGEGVTQWYRVPDSFDRKDLEAWLDGDAWTDAESGTPFGKIRVKDCSEAGVDKDYLCSA